MNTLKSLLVALFVVGLIACSSNPTDSGDEFEPYKVGSFMITSPDKAEYVGVNQKSLSKTLSEEVDTTFITDNTDYGLHLERDTVNEHAFELVFIDSSVTLETVEETSWKTYGRRVNPDFPIVESGSSRYIDSDRFIGKMGLMYSRCGEASSGEETNFIIEYYSGNYPEKDTTYAVYHITMDKFENAIRDVAC